MHYRAGGFDADESTRTTAAFPQISFIVLLVGTPRYHTRTYDL